MQADLGLCYPQSINTNTLLFNVAVGDLQLSGMRRSGTVAIRAEEQ